VPCRLGSAPTGGAGRQVHCCIAAKSVQRVVWQGAVLLFSVALCGPPRTPCRKNRPIKPLGRIRDARPPVPVGSFVHSINLVSSCQSALPQIENIRPGLLRCLRVIDRALGKAETVMRAGESRHGVRHAGPGQGGAQIRDHMRRHRLIVLGEGVVQLAFDLSTTAGI
jgi:hypothetical protein